MDQDERKLVEEATQLCERAATQKLTVLFRRQSDEADVVVTTATEPAMVTALMAAAGEPEE